ncbi:MAG: M1 family aminopeptidase [Microscillaceae bacterium]|nr:M1 family aminopeptidase [Microscillaceae bacterium]
MFLKIFAFELKYRMIRPATYVYCLILFLFTFLNIIYGSGPSSEKTFVNSPQAISLMLVILTIFSMLISSAIMGVPVYRDIEHQTHTYFFSYPIREREYLLGRFLGSFIVLIFVNLGAHLGIMLGAAIGPFLGLEDAERFGSFQIMHYIYPTLVFTIPNILFTGAIFFALVALTRKIFATYVASIVLFIAYLLGNSLTQDIEYRNWVDILDPFALNTYGNATRYWTPVEQNTLLVPLEGNLLWNRLLWVGISLLITAYAFWRFKFSSFLAISSGKAKAKEKEIQVPRLAKLPVPNLVYSSKTYFYHLFNLAGLEFRNIVRDVYFFAILLGGVLFLFLDGWFGSPTYGTPSLPLTYYMLEVKDFEYIVFVFIIIVFYTGETVHRDKSVHFTQIFDALPIPNWVIYGSKFLALTGVAFLLVNIIWIVGVMNQTLQGYFNYEFGKYFTDLYLIEFPEYMQLVMLAFIIHILVNSKFVGHVINIALWLTLFGIRSFAEVDFNMFFYSYVPAYLVSDMNGFGHFAKPLFWFNMYWLSLGAIFIVLGNLFWSRGTEAGLKSRLQLARQRLNRFSLGMLVLFALVFVGSGAYIYYNVSVLNRYLSPEASRKLSAEYEKKFQKYEWIAQPKVTDAKLYVDIYPETRSIKASGKFMVVNKTAQAIDSLHLNLNSQIYHTYMTGLKIAGKAPKLLFEDKIHRYFIYKLPQKMAPGDTLLMEVAVKAEYRGFTNSGFNQSIVANGTFSGLDIFPGLGYNAAAELGSDKYRKKYKLPVKKYTLPPQNDPKGLRTLLFNDDADYVTFEAVLSTSPDQIAVAPGYLQKEWIKNGRRYFHYKMNDQIDFFANFSSARYKVYREVWNSPEGKKVNIEIFHHPGHTHNLDRFAKSVKMSLDYYSQYFSPYQYTQLRILEFPRYASFAQSFPNTVPYSESFGWVADFSNPEDTDYSFFVTAHEVAHQWWGHQITPSYTRGANQISESMAEYAALMILKKEYGEAAMQKFLKYELDRYLAGRSNEDKFEETLLENDSRAYVWYQKGGMVLYALQDYIGEQQLNKAFKAFLKDAAFRQKPPFATSKEWYSYIKKVTPDSLKYLVEDCFEKITLYENRIKEAKYQKLKNGRYKVSLKVHTQKLYYDKSGKEIAQGKNKDLIEIGVFAEDGKNKQGMTQKVPLYLKKHWLAPGDHVLEFELKAQPAKAGIDPYNKLIDRISDDNIMPVSAL